MTQYLLPSGGISVKPATNIQHVNGHCWRGFQGQSSRPWPDQMLEWCRCALWWCMVEAHLFWHFHCKYANIWAESWRECVVLQGGIWRVPLSIVSIQLQHSASGACWLQLLLQADSLWWHRYRWPVCRQNHQCVQSAASTRQTQSNDLSQSYCNNSYYY